MPKSDRIVITIREWDEFRALLNVARAAQELDALFDGEPGAWRLGGVWVAEDAATALLSLHDYLNDVGAVRTCTCGHEDSDGRADVLRCPIHGPGLSDPASTEAV